MPAISVQNLSKAYRIGVKQDSPDTLVGAVKNLVAAPFRNAKRLRRLNTINAEENDSANPDTLWALKDVSFEVNQGDVVGVIGRNGAGKSTLLKVLSRITEPTSGRVVVRGRVSSLLEVGTGFHPELSGRDNIYLNGTILGMTKREIDSKFDEIVEFSGVEKFIDTPTKRYSSGMQVRLAFAVAAHLEPEILIVDEVLAVGDADFQEKCMGKMREVASSGRTVIFVSHNLRSVRALCQKGIVFQSGTVQANGTIDEAISCYVDSIRTRTETDVDKRTDRGGNGRARLRVAETKGHDDQPIVTGSPVSFVFEYQSELPNVHCAFTIYDDRGNSLIAMSSSPSASVDVIESPDGKRFECTLAECPMLPGRYRINVALHCGDDQLDHVEGALSFTVEGGYMRGRCVRGDGAFGQIVTPHIWSRTNAQTTDSIQTLSAMRTPHSSQTTTCEY